MFLCVKGSTSSRRGLLPYCIDIPTFSNPVLRSEDYRPAGIDLSPQASEYSKRAAGYFCCASHFEKDTHHRIGMVVVTAPRGGKSRSWSDTLVAQPPIQAIALYDSINFAAY